MKINTAANAIRFIVLAGLVAIAIPVSHAGGPSQSVINDRRDKDNNSNDNNNNTPNDGKRDGPDRPLPALPTDPNADTDRGPQRPLPPLPADDTSSNQGRPLPPTPPVAADDDDDASSSGDGKKKAKPQTPPANNPDWGAAADDDDASTSGDGKKKAKPQKPAADKPDWGQQAQPDKDNKQPQQPQADNATVGKARPLKDANLSPLTPNRPVPPAPGPVLKDANLGKKNPPDAEPQGNQAAQQNKPIVLRDANQSSSQDARVARDNKSKKTYDRPLVTPFNPGAPPTVQYQGDLRFEQDGGVRLSSAGTLNGRPVGEFIGGGANSKVYTSSDPTKVKKIVSLQQAGRSTKEVAKTITDQDGGRAILNDIQKARPISPFTVTQQAEKAIVRATDDKGKEYRFLMSREDNISSDVYRSDGSQVMDKKGRPAKASNLAERLTLRGEPLSDPEALTLELVMRDLNDFGIVWTDNKPQNLDIVRDDDNSPTGYRVVFFDFDGFRPVKGNTRTERLKAAREIQRVFDAPAVAKPNDPATAKATGRKDDGGWADLEQRLTPVYDKYYPGAPQRLDSLFDYTAFGEPIGTLATPTANMDMGKFILYNAMLPETFATEVRNFNQATGRNAMYLTFENAVQ